MQNILEYTMDKFVTRHPSKVSSVSLSKLETEDEIQITTCSTSTENNYLTISIETMEDGLLGKARITPD